jgi:uncharacterized protein with GYD domain
MEPSTAWQLLAEAARGLEDGRYRLDDVRRLLESLSATLESVQALNGAPGQPDHDEELFYATSLYREALEVAWQGLEAADPTAVTQAAELMERAERALRHILEKSQRELSALAETESMMQRFRARRFL